MSKLNILFQKDLKYFNRKKFVILINLVLILVFVYLNKESYWNNNDNKDWKTITITNTSDYQNILLKDDLKAEFIVDTKELSDHLEAFLRIKKIDIRYKIYLGEMKVTDNYNPGSLGMYLKFYKEQGVYKFQLYCRDENYGSELENLSPYKVSNGYRYYYGQNDYLDFFYPLVTNFLLYLNEKSGGIDISIEDFRDSNHYTPVSRKSFPGGIVIFLSIFMCFLVQGLIAEKVKQNLHKANGVKADSP